MKTTRLLAASVVAVAATLFSGCASRIIEAASSELRVETPDAKVSVKLPKELDAKTFALVVNPTTGEYKLTAETLKSSSQGVIDRAGAAQAEALAEMSRTLNALVPLVAPFVPVKTPVQVPPPTQPVPAPVTSGSGS